MALSSSKKTNIILKHKGDSYCLNGFHSCRTENKLKYHKKLCKNKDFCDIVMPSEKNNILKFNQIKSDKMPYIIYVDLKSFNKKIDGYANNLEKSYTTKMRIFSVNGHLITWKISIVVGKIVGRIV